MVEDKLLNLITEYISENIFKSHLENSISKNSNLSSYKINPILSRYLSKILVDEYNPEGFAKALYYPRVLGTSITTTFGTEIQKMFVELNLAIGAKAEGLDIQFKDKIENKEKWCQLKAGPNTINSDDVAPIINKFDKFVRRARTNSALKGISNNDIILGILYGEHSELSQHYLKIDHKYPVIIGVDFWHRLTGFPSFYEKLVIKLDSLIQSYDHQNKFYEGYEMLLSEIRDSNLF